MISEFRIQKGPKPLDNKTFYLDIKNHALSDKLETKIKGLGGVSILELRTKRFFFREKSYEARSWSAEIPGRSNADRRVNPGEEKIKR